MLKRFVRRRKRSSVFLPSIHGVDLNESEALAGVLRRVLIGGSRQRPRRVVFVVEAGEGYFLTLILYIKFAFLKNIFFLFI